MEQTPPLIAIVGATGTGKSRLSLDLAALIARRGGTAEIVNADAMQQYRGMDIGTAKVPPEDRGGIRHHLLDVLDPMEEASVADYQDEARRSIEQIQDRGAVPILVGGSGLYVASVLYRLDFPGTDPAVRRALENDLEQQGPQRIYERLHAVDPAAAEAIGPRNGRRLVRALEVVDLTGRPFPAALPALPWRPVATVALEAPRARLVEILDHRVSLMWRARFIEEVEGLSQRGLGVTARRAIGYAQALDQLGGLIGEEEAIESTRVLTRRYARRQVSWFRRYPAMRVAFDAPDLARQVLASVMGQD